LFTTTLAICISSRSGGTALLGLSVARQSRVHFSAGSREATELELEVRTGTGERNEEGEKDARDRGDSANFRTVQRMERE